MISAKKKLEVLREEWHACTRCGLHETRLTNDIYFGYGSPTPKYLIVGGTPNGTDEKYSALFAGDQGSLLFQILEDSGINLTDECYFTYAVSCRPSVTIPATETEEEKVENREPSKEEVVACRPRLNEILYQTDPRAIITLGEIATRAVIRGRVRKFLDIQGRQFTALLPRALPEKHKDKIQGEARWFDIVYPVFPVPEMLTILNNPSQADHGPLAITMKTIERVRTYVDFVERSEQDTMNKKEE